MKRFKFFLSEFFVKELGVGDYWFRVEYQHRGSPHVHGLIWLPNAPDISNPQITDKEITDFVDKYISTVNPGVGPGEVWAANYSQHRHPSEVAFKDVLDHIKDRAVLVNFLVRHSKCITGRCLKDGKCRFHFPKKLVPKTHVVHSADGKEINVETERNEPYVTSYCPALLPLWRANLDFQFIDRKGKLVTYLVKYTTKSESQSESLKKVSAMCNVHGPRDSAKRVVQEILTASVADRDMSAQEVMHLLLSLPMHMSSREFVSANTGDYQLIEHHGTRFTLLERYVQRHKDLENCCFYDFASKYQAGSIKIGTMPTPRRKDAIVLVGPYINGHRESESFYRQQIMLEVPFRDPDQLKDPT
jgi:hypothetical protein